MSMSNRREIVQITKGVPASDGAGVKLTRIIASPELDMVDPFLLLDQFESENPDDYIAGFPSHPHRGIETVTYMLAGRMRHVDNAGNEGVVTSGGVQWMTAGRGIVHSEMPEQEKGLMRGFQLWINLPASHKMTAPGYQEFNAETIPSETIGKGGIVRVIAGETDQGTVGPVINEWTQSLYLDITLSTDDVFQQSVPDNHNAVIYVLEGTVDVAGTAVETSQLGVFGPGLNIEISANSGDAQLLLIAGKPLDEPVVRWGPFVMNSRAEIVQALQDFQTGRF
ncbi:MAG: pirin family protein [Cyanobacteria bacterium P01_F01_bin.53]